MGGTAYASTAQTKKTPKIRPILDQVLLKRSKNETLTPGGLVIPESAQEKSVTAEVLAVGEGAFSPAGVRIPLSVKPGDVVILSKWGGTEVSVEDNEYMFLREEEILGVKEI
jgi:chaperonin GroES